MKRFWYIFACLSMVLASTLAGCGGETPIEKAIIGTWVQETPTSTTSGGLQTMTTDTVLTLKKNGETHLTRNLDITGGGLPETGIRVSVELKGQWQLADTRLVQQPNSVLVIPRELDELSREWADKLQEQAEKSPASVKKVISAEKKQLILQDVQLGTTDVYRRK